jgi:hypothetical protein
MLLFESCEISLPARTRTRKQENRYSSCASYWFWEGGSRQRARGCLGEAIRPRRADFLDDTHCVRHGRGLTASEACRSRPRPHPRLRPGPRLHRRHVPLRTRTLGRRGTPRCSGSGRRSTTFPTTTWRLTRRRRHFNGRSRASRRRTMVSRSCTGRCGWRRSSRGTPC